MANVVADALSQITMCSVSRVDEENQDLVQDIRRLSRLGVRLNASLNRGFIVHHNSESTLIVEGKSKKHLDQPLMELRESVLG